MIPKRIPNLNEFIEKGKIYEFMVSDMSSLKKYLTMSDDAKAEGLSYDFYHTWEDFTYHADHLDLDPQQVQDWEDIESLDSKVLKEWNKWLFNKISRGGYEELGIYDSDLPSWSFMSYVKDIRNQWLIHFSDKAYEIAYDGTFKYGIDDLSKLGLTTHMSDADKRYGGYNFAYLPHHAERYAKERHGYKYGSKAVIFRASGILVDHHSDEEPQVIFYGKTATNINYIDLGGGDWTINSKKTGEPLVTKDEPTDLIAWIEQNQRQYSKHLN